MSQGKQTLQTPEFTKLVQIEHAIRAQDVLRQTDPEKTKFLNPDAGLDSDEVTHKIYDSLLGIYNHNSQDSSQYKKQMDHIYFRSEDVPAPELRDIYVAIGKITQKLYDEKGCLKEGTTQKQALAVLQELYSYICAEVPLSNVRFSAGVLVCRLAASEKLRPLFAKGLDFSRAHHGDSLETRFERAATGNGHNHATSQFIQPPDGYIGIDVPYDDGHTETFRFPKVLPDRVRTHLLTEHGFLVNLTTSDQGWQTQDGLKEQIIKHLKAGKHIGDFPEMVVREAETPHIYRSIEIKHVKGDEKVLQRLTDLRHDLLALHDSDKVDGKQVTYGDESHAKLLCMDTDLLTGLYMNHGKPSELDKFKALCKKCGFGSDAMGMSDLIGLMPEDSAEKIDPAVIIKHIEEKFKPLRDAAKGDEAMMKIVNRAEENMERIAPKVAQSVDKAFRKPDGCIKKSAHQSGVQPNFYMTQGGMGSGKSYAEELAKSECGDGLIIAGLDAVRAESQQYNLYLGTDNHNDDYKKFEEFGKLIRAMTVRRAQASGYDLLLDGTGIPYQGRYDKVVENFKHANVGPLFDGKPSGYATSVLAADVPLYVNEPLERDRLFRKGLAPDDGLYRTGKRQVRNGRALPLTIISQSHFSAPEAIMNAALDPNVDRFRLVDTAPDLGKSYTLSYTVDINAEQLEKLKGKHGKDVKAILTQEHLEPVKDNPQFLRLPEGDGELSQFKVLDTYDDGKRYRIQVITDMERYLGVAEKALYNRYVKTKLEQGKFTGPEEYTVHTLPFDVEGDFMDEKNRLRTQPAKGVGVGEWQHHSRAIG